METKIFKTLNLDGVDKKVIATSYSQIDTYLNCPYKWYMSYLLGYRKNVKAEALDLGSAVHETLEDYFNSVKNGKTPTLAEAHNILDLNLDMNDIPYLSEENKVVAEEQHHNMIDGLSKGESNLAEFMKDKEVVACEKDFRLKIDLPFDIIYDGEKYNSIYIIGSIDFITKDKNGNLYVIDFKSGKTLFKPKKLKENLQLKIYSIVVQRIYGRLPVSTQYYFTRFDTFQNVLPLGNNDSDRHYEYYKNGNVKVRGSIVSEIYDELINIFRQQYTILDYPANCTPFCSWCDYSPLYSKDTRCTKGQKYIRKDLPIPKGYSVNPYKRKRGRYYSKSRN